MGRRQIEIVRLVKTILELDSQFVYIFFKVRSTRKKSGDDNRGAEECFTTATAGGQLRTPNNVDGDLSSK